MRVVIQVVLARVKYINNLITQVRARAWASRITSSNLQYRDINYVPVLHCVCTRIYICMGRDILYF